MISCRDIRIFSDSQAALKSLASASTNSTTVHNCRSSLNEMAEQFNIHLIWVPGHRDVPGNCKADELAKNGTILPNVINRHNIGTPLATCKLSLKQHAQESINSRWSQSSTCLVTKQIWPSIDVKRSKSLISLGRSQISSTIGVLTGHCLIGRHAIRLGVPSNDFCRSCMDEEEEETIQHLLCTCPALSNRRNIYLGNFFFDNTSELATIDVRCLSRFIDSTKWFF